MKNKISIYDVAKHVGVSPASVSYVVNGINKVSEETKEKILKGIQELGFIPDNGARYLSTGKSHFIGLLLPTSASLAFEQNPFYGEFIGGLEKVLSENDFDLVISGVKSNREYSKWFASRSFAAVVLIGKYPKEVYETINKLKIPAILIDVYEEYANEFNNVRINDEKGCYIATKHMIEYGHTNIGFVFADNKESMLDQKRFQGYVKAMKEYNLPIKDEWIFNVEATFDGGYNVACQIKECKELTGVVCAADIIAIGIIKYYSEKGLKLPDNLSLVGFDDITACAYVYPGLTTIHQDIRQKGLVAAELIIDSVNNNISKKTIELQPYLVSRQSVKKIINKGCKEIKK